MILAEGLLGELIMWRFSSSSLPAISKPGQEPLGQLCSRVFQGCLRRGLFGQTTLATGARSRSLNCPDPSTCAFTIVDDKNSERADIEITARPLAQCLPSNLISCKLALS